MKKIYALLLLIITLQVSHLSAQDLADLDTYEKSMKPGAELSYDVTANGKQFKMVVTLKKVGAEVAFDWKTTDPDNKSGSVTMSANAVATAKAFSNIFKGGATSLESETSLWASKQLCTEIVANAQASVKVKGASDTATVLGNTMGLFNLNLNGNGVSLSGYELQGGSPVYTIDIIESPKFPLIYKLDIGWTMVLTDIKI